MTYKYFRVREEVYTSCSKQKLYRSRTFDEVRKLFKKQLWIVCTIIVFSSIAALIISLTSINNLWLLIPAIIAFSLIIIAKTNFDSFYHTDMRNKEIQERDEVYEEYLQNISNALLKCGIKTSQQMKLLKQECEFILDQHKEKYSVFKGKVYDILIGVPLGALISALICVDSGNIISQIVAIIVIGLIIIGLTKMCRILTFYSDQYFKDRHLLGVLKEMEYVSEE